MFPYKLDYILRLICNPVRKATLNTSLWMKGGQVNEDRQNQPRDIIIAHDFTALNFNDINDEWKFNECEIELDVRS